MAAIDLDAYCARIGYAGPREPTYEVLEALHRAHPNAIPFEALNPLQGLPVKLDPKSLEDKLVRRARGGYCFEQNGLLLHVLRAAGFKVTPLAARVLWMQPPEAPSPLTHMMLITHLSQGDYLCDVGFGGQNPIAPLRLEPGMEQKTRHGTFRLDKTALGYELAIRLPENWAPMYRFTLEEQTPRDYEMYNWFTSTHPSVRFVNSLMMARIAPEARYALLNREFSTYFVDGRIERKAIESPEELQSLLSGVFGITVGDDERDRIWARANQPSQAGP